MIGQTIVKSQITDMIESGVFPRFTILVGPAGSGKKLLCKYISSTMKAQIVNCGISVDDIREMITRAYSATIPILFVIADADKMSLAAKNALLKVTEEPPRSAYFIMTLTDLNNTLATVRSRGTTLYMDTYIVDDLIHYSREKTNYTIRPEETEIISNICETPGEVDTLLAMNAKEFYSYVEKVVDNIAKVSGSNSFKIADKVALKESDTDKYDLRLFWKAFMCICSLRLKDESFKYMVGITITSKYLQDLRITGINKQSTFDMWLLDIRKEWM